MGFGVCIKPTPRRPAILRSRHPSANPSKLHCTAFYWDISSVFAKSVCLAIFLIAEGPRRTLAFIARKPEPIPSFTCVKWGFRMCTCGHHYYDHGDMVPSKQGSPLFERKTPQVEVGERSIGESNEFVGAGDVDSVKVAELIKLQDKGKANAQQKEKMARKRRWYWPF